MPVIQGLDRQPLTRHSGHGLRRLAAGTWPVFWPSTPSANETGFRRGACVIASPDMAGALHACDLSADDVSGVGAS